MKATSKTTNPIKEDKKPSKPDDNQKGAKKPDAQDDKNKKGGKDDPKDKAAPTKDDAKGSKAGKDNAGKDQGKGGKDDKTKGGKDDKTKGGKDDKGKKGKKDDSDDDSDDGDVKKKGAKGGKDDKGAKGGKDDKGAKSGKDDKGKGGKDDKGAKGGKDDKDKGGKNDKGKKSKDDSDDSDEDQKKEKGKARNGSIDASRLGRSKDGKGDIKGNRSKTQGKKKVEEEEKKEVRRNINPYIQVTEFYLGQFKAPICGADIFEMHSWKGQYPHLDINHAYFHWLFPHFQGQFGKERATMFKENAVIGKRIIDSYKLILDFYGIQLDDEATGVTSRAENYLVRYKDTFLRPFTNHDFRVKRMLQFLNVTGFRVYAVELVKYFEREIFKIGKNQLPPLRTLELTFKIDWQAYGQLDEKDKKAIDQFNQKCLFPYEIVSKEPNAHLKTLS